MAMGIRRPSDDCLDHRVDNIPRAVAVGYQPAVFNPIRAPILPSAAAQQWRAREPIQQQYKAARLLTTTMAFVCIPFSLGTATRGHGPTVRRMPRKVNRDTVPAPRTVQVFGARETKMVVTTSPFRRPSALRASVRRPEARLSKRHVDTRPRALETTTHGAFAPRPPEC